MVIEYIEKLQQKPEHVRRQIAVGVTTAIFAAIVSIWITTSPILGENSGDQELANVGGGVEIDTPFETLKGIFSGAVEAVNEAKEGGLPEGF